MNIFLTSNSWQYRLLRTIVQGVIGVIVANLDLLLAKVSFDPTLKPMIAALCMAVLSPVMATLGNENAKPEDPVVPYKPDNEVEPHD